MSDAKLKMYVEVALSALLEGEEPRESCIINIRRNGLRAIQLTQNYMRRRLLVNWLNSLYPHIEEDKELTIEDTEYDDKYFKEVPPETIETFDASDGTTILSIVKSFITMDDIYYDICGVKYHMLPKEFTDIEFRKISTHTTLESAEEAVRWLLQRHSLDEMRYFAIHRCWPNKPVTIDDLNPNQEYWWSPSCAKYGNQDSGSYRWPIDLDREAWEREKKWLDEEFDRQQSTMKFYEKAIDLLDEFPEWQEKLIQAKASSDFYEISSNYLTSLRGEFCSAYEEPELYDFEDLWLEKASGKPT